MIQIMKYRTIISPLLIMFLGFNSAFYAKVAPMELSGLVKRADVIVVGKVTKIIIVNSASAGVKTENAKIAEVEVSRVLKGGTRLKRLYYWASPTWACDVSGANEGEEVLLLLETRVNQTLSTSLQKYIQDSPLYYIAFSGGGRMVIKGKLIERNGHIIYPKTFKIVRRLPLKYDHISMYALEEVESFVKKELGRHKMRLTFVAPERADRV
jgi:hypothetical protein